MSGGSEAVETALKMARAYHLAKGQGGRSIVIGRRNSYHGNTLGALDASGKAPLRKPYTPWLGRFLHVSAAYEFRCENPQHPHGCGAWQAAELEKMIASYGEDTVAAFIAEPIVGRHARRGRARRRLLAGDRRGLPAPRRGADRRRGDDRVRPDGLVVRHGPLGRPAGHPHGGEGDDRAATCRSGSPPRRAASTRRSPAGPGFVHGFTWSHNALGAAAGLAVLGELKAGLVDRSRELGARLLDGLRDALADAPTVGDVRGLGLMIGIELVRDRETNEPFPRVRRRSPSASCEAARESGLLLYSSTGHVDGTNGDLVMLGPPFSISDEDATPAPRADDRRRPQPSRERRRRADPLPRGPDLRPRARSSAPAGPGPADLGPDRRDGPGPARRRRGAAAASRPPTRSSGSSTRRSTSRRRRPPGAGRRATGPGSATARGTTRSSTGCTRPARSSPAPPWRPPAPSGAASGSTRSTPRAASITRCPPGRAASASTTTRPSRSPGCSGKAPSGSPTSTSTSTTATASRRSSGTSPAC